MNELGDLIRSRRTELGLSRLSLAGLCSISHTEVARIENGERKLPSVKVLYALADGLRLSREEVLRSAGYGPQDELSPVQRAFPALRTPKQVETVERVVDGLARNAQLRDEDLDDLCRQVEMFLAYAGRKKDP